MGIHFQGVHGPRLQYQAGGWSISSGSRSARAGGRARSPSPPSWAVRKPRSLEISPTCSGCSARKRTHCRCSWAAGRSSTACSRAGGSHSPVVVVRSAPSPASLRTSSRRSTSPGGIAGDGGTRRVRPWRGSYWCARHRRTGTGGSSGSRPRSDCRTLRQPQQRRGHPLAGKPPGPPLGVPGRTRFTTCGSTGAGANPRRQGPGLPARRLEEGRRSSSPLRLATCLRETTTNVAWTMR